MPTGKRTYPGVNGKIRPTGRILLYIRFSTELSNPFFFATDQSFFSSRKVLIKTREAISDESDELK